MERDKGRKEKKSGEKKKLGAGQREVDSAMRHPSRAVFIGDDGDENSAEESDGREETRKKRRVINHAQHFEGKIDRFGSFLKESDDGLLRLERRKVDLE